MPGKPLVQKKMIWRWKMKNSLYGNINAKQKRIAAGSGEKMNKVGSKAAPSAKDFKQAAKTAKPMKAKKK